MKMDDKWYEEPLTVCPICKKMFAPAPMHYWKIGKARMTNCEFRTRNTLVCSYTCMRTWEKENFDKKIK